MSLEELAKSQVERLIVEHRSNGLRVTLQAGGYLRVTITRKSFSTGEEEVAESDMFTYLSPLYVMIGYATKPSTFYWKRKK